MSLLRIKNLRTLAFVAIGLGLALRLTCGNDIEYKADEKNMYALSQTGAPISEWPSLGLVSGASLKNPGMSVWVFTALTRVFKPENPPALSRIVAWLSVLSLLGWAFFIWRKIEREETKEVQEVWYLGLILAAVNPLSIVFERKIWAQSVLPIFCFLVFLGWWSRHRKWGAFLFGFFGILIGQIHMSGYFWFGTLAIGALGFHSALKSPREKPLVWKPFLIGGAIAALPSVPWIQYLFSEGLSAQASAIHHFNNLPTLRFWRMWLSTSMGIDLKHSLGSDSSLFYHLPTYKGQSSYLIAGIHLALIVGWGSFILRRLYFFCKDFKTASVSGRSFFRMPRTETAFILRLSFILYGFILSLLPVQVSRSYLIAAYPFVFLWLAHIAVASPTWAQLGRRLVWMTVVAQIILTSSFLWFIHQNGGAPGGDFGISWATSSGRE